MRLDEPGWWYGSGRREELVARLLAPLGELYGSVLQSRFEGHGPYASRLPVICIGNFTAGGTGKTPLALFVMNYLTSLGESPVCLTRGYGGSVAGPAWVARGASTAREVGDEPLLLARAGPTLVARDRKAGARLIEEEQAPASVIVMDDGMQNPELKKDLVLAVVDGSRGLGNGRVIPAGPLRAPLEFQAGLVDCVVVNGAGGEHAYAEGSVIDRLKRSFPGPVLAAEVAPVGDVEWLKAAPVVAYAGIGSPDRFFQLLADLGAEHHRAQSVPRPSRILAGGCRSAPGRGLEHWRSARDDGEGPGAARGRDGEVRGASGRVARACHPPQVRGARSHAAHVAHRCDAQGQGAGQTRRSALTLLVDGLEIAAERNLGRGIGFLQLDAPVAQIGKLDRLAGDGAAHELARRDNLELAVEVADLSLATDAEQFVEFIHQIPRRGGGRARGPRTHVVVKSNRQSVGRRQGFRGQFSFSSLR